MQARAEAEIQSHKMVWSCSFFKFLSTVVIFLRLTQYFQIMPNFEDFQQLKSWKRQGAGAPTKFYKSNKENISCPIAVYSRKLWKSKTNFEHWKFMKSHQIAQYREKLSPNLPLENSRLLYLAGYNWQRGVRLSEYAVAILEYWNKSVAQPLRALHHSWTQKVILCLWHRERSRLLVDAF